MLTYAVVHCGASFVCIDDALINQMLKIKTVDSTMHINPKKGLGFRLCFRTILLQLTDLLHVNKLLWLPENLNCTSHTTQISL